MYGLTDSHKSTVYDNPTARLRQLPHQNLQMDSFTVITILNAIISTDIPPAVNRANYHILQQLPKSFLPRSRYNQTSGRFHLIIMVTAKPLRLLKKYSTKARFRCLFCLMSGFIDLLTLVERY